MTTRFFPKHIAWWSVLAIVAYIVIVLNTRHLTGAEVSDITPKPDVQAILNSIAEETNDQRRFEQWYQLPLRLKALNVEEAELVRQLIWQRAHAANLEQATFYRIVVLSEFSAPSPKAMAEAIVPLLGKKWENHRIEKSVNDMAELLDHGTRERPYNFNHYSNVISEMYKQGKDIPTGLVVYMFERHPGRALLSLAEACYHDKERKPFLWAEHIIDDALWKKQYQYALDDSTRKALIEQLATMVLRKEYWARLYVAKIIAMHPELSSDKIIEKLRKDSNTLVQQAATNISELSTQKSPVSR